MNTNFVTLFRRFFPTHIFWQENSKTFYLLSTPRKSTQYKCINVNENEWIVEMSINKHIQGIFTYYRKTA